MNDVPSTACADAGPSGRFFGDIRNSLRPFTAIAEPVCGAVVVLKLWRFRARLESFQTTLRRQDERRILVTFETNCPRVPSRLVFGRSHDPNRETRRESRREASQGGTESAPARAVVPIPAGLRQSLRLRGGSRRAAGRPELAAAAAARSLCRADFRYLIHHRARRKPPHLDLPYPAVGRAPALRAHRQRPDPQRAVQRNRRDADAIALVAVSDSEEADRFRRGHCYSRRQRRRRHPGRHGDPRLRRQPLDE